MKIKMLFGALVALATLAGCNAQQPASASLDDLFLTRRSIRNYEPGRTISEAQVRELLTAAQNAPSWANQQPSKYYVAISPEKHDAVLEMRTKYPDKAVTFFSQQYPQYGWAILMAGGSLPNVPLQAGVGNPYHDDLLQAIPQMKPMEASGCVALGNDADGYLLYAQGDTVSLNIQPSTYGLFSIEASTGRVILLQKKLKADSTFLRTGLHNGQVLWLRRK